MEQENIMTSHWEVHRSRNKGRTWSNLTHGMKLSKEQAYEFADNESEKHPSDWLRVVRVEEVVELGYNCYCHSKKPIPLAKKESPITVVKILKDPTDSNNFNEICKRSLGGLQTFK